MRINAFAVTGTEPGQTPRKVSYPREERLPLWYVGVRQDSLVYSCVSLEFDPVAEKVSYSPYMVYSIPIADLGKEGVKPALIYSRTAPIDSAPGLDVPVYFGPKMMAYVENGVLHARTYDGKVDVTLESGVRMLYDATTRKGEFGLR